jgi:hypothetical protein
MTVAASTAGPRQRTRCTRGGSRFTGRTGLQPAIGALPRLRIVGDAGEPPAQLHRGGQLAAPLVDDADRSGISLGDDEHRLKSSAYG